MRERERHRERDTERERERERQRESATARPCMDTRPPASANTGAILSKQLVQERGRLPAEVAVVVLEAPRLHRLLPKLDFRSIYSLKLK